MSVITTSYVVSGWTFGAHFEAAGETVRMKDPLVVDEDFSGLSLGAAGIAQLNAAGWGDGRGGDIDDTKWTIANVGGINVLQQTTTGYYWVAPPGTYLEALMRVLPRPGSAASGLEYSAFQYRDDGGGIGVRHSLRLRFYYNMLWIYGAGVTWGSTHTQEDIVGAGGGDKRFETDVEVVVGVLDDAAGEVYAKVNSPNVFTENHKLTEKIYRQKVTDHQTGASAYRFVCYQADAHVEGVQIYERRSGTITSPNITVPGTSGSLVSAKFHVTIPETAKLRRIYSGGSWHTITSPSDVAALNISSGDTIQAELTLDNADDITVQAIFSEFSLTVDTPDTKSVILKTLNGGETLDYNSSFTIRWDGINLEAGDTIDVQYRQNAGAWQNIALGLAFDVTSTVWNYGTGVTGGNLEILVTLNKLGGGTETDQSDAVFSIDAAPNKIITLESLNGGEDLSYNSTFTIRWGTENTEAGDTIDVYYNINAGADVAIVTGLAFDATSTVWDYGTPGLYGSGFKIKVVLNKLGGGTEEDESIGTFSIDAPPAALPIGGANPNINQM